MSDHDDIFGDVPAEEIYFLDGSQKEVIVYRRGDMCNYFDASIDEAAIHFGLNSFLWPDGQGFALNFGKISGIHEVYQALQDGTGKTRTKVFPAIDPHDKTRRSVSLPCLPRDGDGTLVVFTDSYKLWLPVAPSDVRQLEHEAVDSRNMMTPPIMKPRAPQQHLLL